MYEFNNEQEKIDFFSAQRRLDKMDRELRLQPNNNSLREEYDKLFSKLYYLEEIYWVEPIPYIIPIKSFFKCLFNF